MCSSPLEVRMGFVHLHCRSAFSLKDGAFLPEALALRTAELGMPAVALTDRDALYGAARFVDARAGRRADRSSAPSSRSRAARCSCWPGPTPATRTSVGSSPWPTCRGSGGSRRSRPGRCCGGQAGVPHWARPLYVSSETQRGQV